MIRTHVGEQKMLATASSVKFHWRESKCCAARPRKTRRPWLGLALAPALAIVPLLAAVALSGCGSARPIRYYQLEVPEIVTTSPDAATYPITIVLGPLITSHLYREDHVVYSTDSEGMGTYDYQRWAEPPTEMIESILLREIRNTNHFREVYSQKTAVHGDYILRGHLYDFKEVSSPNLLARVAFDLELHDTKTGAIVWAKTYRHDEPVSVKEPAAVVSALDKNVEHGLHEAADSMAAYFAANPPAAK
jgi:cholesterol transport system auxiliary component